MKIAKVRLDNIHQSDTYYELQHDLNISDKIFDNTFEFGEFATIEIYVDKDLNIVGGKFIPIKEW